MDEAAALAGLWSQLDDLDIRPGGWVDDDGETSFEESLDTEPSPDERHSEPQVSEYNDHSMSLAQVAAPSHSDEVDEGSAAYPAALSGTEPDVTSQPTHSRATPEAVKSANHGVLAAYREFDGRTVPVDDASRDELVEGIAAIVKIEGPILGERLRHVYVKASGGERVGRVIASTLNKALWAATQNGILTTSNPLNKSGQAAKVFRLPDQPTVFAREIGPRTLAQMPPLELAHVLSLAAEDADDLPQTELYRRALALLGRKSLTDASRAQLDQVIGLDDREQQE